MSATNPPGTVTLEELRAKVLALRALLVGACDASGAHWLAVMCTLGQMLADGLAMGGYGDLKSLELVHKHVVVVHERLHDLMEAVRSAETEKHDAVPTAPPPGTVLH